MDSPAVHDVIVDTGAGRAFFGLLFRFVAGEFQKAVQSLFIQQRLIVLLDIYAVVDFVGENFGSVLFEIRFDSLLFFGRCFQIEFHCEPP